MNEKNENTLGMAFSILGMAACSAVLCKFIIRQVKWMKENEDYEDNLPCPAKRYLDAVIKKITKRSEDD